MEAVLLYCSAIGLRSADYGEAIARSIRTGGAMQIFQDSTKNRLLRALAPADFGALAPYLIAEDLPIRKVLQSRGRKIEQVYFPESGIASIVATAGGRHAIEVGIVGCEGMTGMTVFQGIEISAFDTFMQAPGTGWRIAASEFRDIIASSASLRASLGAFCHVMFVQMAYTALADGRYKLDERLARWLLMALDRTNGNVVTLTHEFLSLMLGVRRPGVTNAITALEGRGIIQTSRGSITIVNRGALQEAANGSYGAPEAEFDKCFGEIKASYARTD